MRRDNRTRTTRIPWTTRTKPEKSKPIRVVCVVRVPSASPQQGTRHATHQTPPHRRHSHRHGKLRADRPRDRDQRARHGLPAPAERHRRLRDRAGRGRLRLRRRRVQDARPESHAPARVCAAHQEDRGRRHPGDHAGGQPRPARGRQARHQHRHLRHAGCAQRLRRQPGGGDPDHLPPRAAAPGRDGALSAAHRAAGQRASSRAKA